jgi:hypothetical protein
MAAASARRFGHSWLGLGSDAALAFVVDNCSIRPHRPHEKSGFSRVVTVNHRPWMGGVW